MSGKLISSYMQEVRNAAMHAAVAALQHNVTTEDVTGCWKLGLTQINLENYR